MTRPVTNHDRAGQRVLAIISVLMLVAAVVLMATSPEPCVDRSGTTVCGRDALIEPAP